jgi:hypothetical protein
MKRKLQTIVVSLLVLGGCRSEPSRAPGSTESTPPALVTAPPTVPPASSSSGSPASPGSEARDPNHREEPKGAKLIKTFEQESAEAAPAGFSFARTGKGGAGKWVVKAEPEAPSEGRVLAQVDADNTNFRFPVAVLNEPALKDVQVGVRCKLISGRVDQACGLVARYRDENNYFVTRANALEDNIRLYTVKDGKRTELASRDIAISPNVWHDYRFQLRGDHLQVFWNGERVLDHHDGTFAEAGQVGVWTKADSITHFDDLRVEAYE